MLIDPREENPPRPVVTAMFMIGIDEAKEQATEEYLEWCKHAHEQLPFLAPQQLSEQEVLEIEELVRTETPLRESAIEQYVRSLHSGECK